MRKKQAVKRDVLPDPIYKSKVVTKLINQIMLDGKKGTAQTILYDAFEQIKDKTNSDPLEVFNKALENIKPALEFISTGMKLTNRLKTHMFMKTNTVIIQIRSWLYWRSNTGIHISYML